jgi:transposase
VNYSLCLRTREQAVILPKANRKAAVRRRKKPYKARHLIENFFAKLKQFRCVATCCDKTATNFLVTVPLTASSSGLF